MVVRTTRKGVAACGLAILAAERAGATRRLKHKACRRAPVRRAERPAEERESLARETSIKRLHGHGLLRPGGGVLRLKQLHELHRARAHGMGVVENGCERIAVLNDVGCNDGVQLEAHRPCGKPAQYRLQFFRRATALSRDELVYLRARIMNRDMDLGAAALLKRHDHGFVQKCGVGDHGHFGLHIPARNLVKCLQKHGLVQKRLASRECDLAASLRLQREQQRPQAPPLGHRRLAPAFFVAEEATVVALRREADAGFAVGVWVI